MWAASSIFEPLERRQLFAVSLGANLIHNPGADDDNGATDTTTVVTPQGWTALGDPTAARYGAVGAFPSLKSPGSSNRGFNFFAGGPVDPASDLFQTIDVSSLASQIDAGKLRFTLAGFLGGSGSQGDNVQLNANFQNATSTFLSQASVG